MRRARGAARCCGSRRARRRLQPQLQPRLVTRPPRGPVASVRGARTRLRQFRLRGPHAARCARSRCCPHAKTSTTATRRPTAMTVRPAAAARWLGVAHACSSALCVARRGARCTRHLAPSVVGAAARTDLAVPGQLMAARYGTVAEPHVTRRKLGGADAASTHRCVPAACVMDATDCASCHQFERLMTVCSRKVTLLHASDGCNDASQPKVFELATLLVNAGGRAAALLLTVSTTTLTTTSTKPTTKPTTSAPPSPPPPSPSPPPPSPSPPPPSPPDRPPPGAQLSFQRARMHRNIYEDTVNYYKCSDAPAAPRRA